MLDRILTWLGINVEPRPLTEYPCARCKTRNVAILYPLADGDFTGLCMPCYDEVEENRDDQE